VSNVIAFPRLLEAKVRAEAVGMPTWALELWGGYFDHSNWRMIRKGNPFVRVGRHPVTLFRHAGGWRWSIGRSAREGPLFSEQTFDGEREARLAAFDALKDMVLAEHRWFMDPANWETIEMNGGYRRCIEVGPHGVILHRRRDGRWEVDIYPNGLLREGDDEVYGTEDAARRAAWQAVATLI
jgi:hypothetical protein